MADDDITDVDRLVEFWHRETPLSPDGHLMFLDDYARERVLKELEAIEILREVAGDPINQAAVIRRAADYLDALDRS